MWSEIRVFMSQKAQHQGWLRSIGHVLQRSIGSCKFDTLRPTRQYIAPDRQLPHAQRRRSQLLFFWTISRADIV